MSYVDIEMVRSIFFAKIENWRRNVKIVRYANILGGSYFEEGDSREPLIDYKDIFITTLNSHEYSDTDAGKQQDTFYTGYATYNTDIRIDDYIVLDSKKYRIQKFSKVLEPITAQVIAQQFELHFVDELAEENTEY